MSSANPAVREKRRNERVAARLALEKKIKVFTEAVEDQEEKGLEEIAAAYVEIVKVYERRIRLIWKCLRRLKWITFGWRRERVRIEWRRWMKCIGKRERDSRTSRKWKWTGRRQK